MMYMMQALLLKIKRVVQPLQLLKIVLLTLVTNQLEILKSQIEVYIMALKGKKVLLLNQADLIMIVEDLQPEVVLVQEALVLLEQVQEEVLAQLEAAVQEVVVTREEAQVQEAVLLVEVDLAVVQEVLAQEVKVVHLLDQDLEEVLKEDQDSIPFSIT